MKQPTKPHVHGLDRTAYCDACHHQFPVSLLTPVGEGALQACPRCLTEAQSVVRTDPRKGIRLVRLA